MQVYGPDAEPGADIYLHTGAGIPALAQRIRAEGYVPGKLTKEVVAHVKKACKQERAICKVVYLSSQYGAGPKKIHETLNMQGVRISETAVREIHYQYWELYKGIKLWEAQLLDKWRVNNGWVLNGIGRPIGVHPDYKKDIVNRVIQSTGHDILVHYIYILDKWLRKHLGTYTPIVIDLHDQTIIEVPENRQEDALYCFRMAIEELNRQMGGVIPLRIVPQVVLNFAEAKLNE
jgi:DNA polymerase I-like protein with 3'-5' exonuclease and polymerase domains